MLTHSSLIRKARHLLRAINYSFVDNDMPSLDNQLIQRQLFIKYQSFRKLRTTDSLFQDVGFRVFSQSDEDGVLLYIFSQIGTTDRRCIEIAFSSPYGSNTTNLICNWGWTGLLLDGKPDCIEEGSRFFSMHRDTYIYPPKLLVSWITAENVNDVLIQNNVLGSVDLLSLDIDGVDYWVWKELTVIQPRVVVVEFQDIWGIDRSVTVPYRPDFVRPTERHDYCGASLPAMAKLASEKGYRLVGFNRYGFNAFFIRKGIGEESLPEIPIEHCLKYPKVLEGYRERLPKVKDLEWIDI